MEFRYDDNLSRRVSNDYRGISRNRYTAERLRKQKKSYKTFKKILFTVFFIIILICASVFGFKLFQKQREKKELSKFSSAQMKQDIYVDFRILGIPELFSLKGLTKQDVYDKVLSSYKFSIKIKNSNPEIDIFDMPIYGKNEEDKDYSKYMQVKDADSLGTGQEVKIVNPLEDISITATKNEFELPDFVEGQVIKFIDDIYDKYLYSASNEFNKKNVDVKSNKFEADFVFKVVNNDKKLDDAISQLSRLWDTKAIKGQIEYFDKEKNEFKFGDDHKGFVIDQDELRRRIIDTVNGGSLTGSIMTALKIVDPDGASVKSKYRYVSMFETWTTDDERRNKNVELACRAINGLIVKPGQEFSFNKVVGQRTEEKGYDYAKAYLEGQIVEELGGGVCQVSTTLYNAIFNAGLTTTYRKSHTFEPSYITPGLDATVSYNGPDYRFINNSGYSVGIRATYAKQKVKVEIFAVPLLQDGIKQNLVAKKIQDLDYPTLSIITEGHATKGTKGSEWQVFKVVKEGEKEIERTLDHSASYLGHTPTAFEEYTYVDNNDGLLKTRKFVETLKPENAKQKKTETTKRR